MNRCIIFDIDGTIANLQHRVHLVQGKKKDWPEFFRLITKDTPIEQTVWLNNIIKYTHGKALPVFIASGRSEKERADTVEWLELHGVKYDQLFMRPANDYRKDTIIKEEILGQIRALGYEPWLIFDDRQCVTEMWRKNGLFVLQCDPNPSEVQHDNFLFDKSIKYPLTVMVGPSGAGKSSQIATAVADGLITYDQVISSDAIRQQLCGDFQDQSKNLQVFEAMHELATTRLRLGLPVVLDATHLRNADRIKAAKIAPEGVPVRYVVINRPLAEKIKTAGWRASVSAKGRPLVEYHDQTFRSNIKAIMAGDNLPNVTVLDLTK